MNNGDGTFSLGPESSGIRESIVAQTAGASFTDVDRDGKYRFVACHSNAEQDRLLLGDGTGNFADVTQDWFASYANGTTKPSPNEHRDIL